MTGPAHDHSGPDINRTAAHYFAAVDAGDMAPEDEAQLAQWLAADTRHADAFGKAATIWASLDSVPIPPPTVTGSRPSKLRWYQAALAAGIATLAFLGADMPIRLQADALTGVGEIRRVALPDGSIATLNTDSAIAYDASGRAVTLLKGEAAFEVARRAGAPFVVTAGDGATTALGTRFLVDRSGDDTSVSVTDHSVRVAVGSGSAVLREGQQMTYGNGHLGTPHVVSVAEVDAWTRGRIRVVNRPLAEVVAQLGRYRHGVIRVVDADLARRPVSGSFDLHDPVGAVNIIEQTLGIASTRLTDRIILLHN